MDEKTPRISLLLVFCLGVGIQWGETGPLQAAEPVLRGRPVFTGQSGPDFGLGDGGQNDPDPLDLYTRVAVDGNPNPELQISQGVISGFDIKQIFFFYHPLNDVLYVGFDTFGIAGDADGDGNPDASSTNGITDSLFFGFYESIDLMIDIDGDNDPDLNDVPDYVFGKPSVNPPTVSNLTTAFRSAIWEDYQLPYAAPTSSGNLLPIHLPDLDDPQELTQILDAAHPHVQFVINDFSKLPKLVNQGFDPYMDELKIRVGAYQGAAAKGGPAGEDDFPTVDNDFLLVPMADVAPFPSPAGTLSGKVMEDWPLGLDDRDGPAVNPTIEIVGNFEGIGSRTIRFAGNPDGTFTTLGNTAFPNGGKVRMGNYTIRVIPDSIFEPTTDLTAFVGVQQDVTDLDFTLIPDDDDGDYILDATEIELAGERGDQDIDKDDDGTPDYLDVDSDGDGFSDQLEANPTDLDGDGDLDFVTDPVETADADGDGLPNHLDVDSDNDGLLDEYENSDPQNETEFDDTDDDGEPDIYDVDSDNDEILDGVEAGVTTDNANPDSGSDYVGDTEPLTSTNPDDPDTDNDCIPDGVEDADQDGNLDPYDTNDWPEVIPETDPNEVDTDGDGLGDYTELGYGAGEFEATENQVCANDSDPTTTTDPRDPDTDDGSDSDGEEDQDGDGAVDDDETNPNYEPDDTDWDEDGIPDTVEDINGTDPKDDDSDNDGLTDLEESELDENGDGFPDDTDGDGNINPLDPDSDNDGIQDGTEIGLTLDDVGEDTLTQEGEYPEDYVFVPDEDDTTTTDYLDDDTDDDGLIDGSYEGLVGEDTNNDGAYDAGAETDPNNANTDADCDNDGMERGLTDPQGNNTDLDEGNFTPDPTPDTTTDPTVMDSVECFAGIAMGGGGIGSCSISPSARPNFGWAVLMVGLMGLLGRRRSLRQRTSPQQTTVARTMVVGAVGLLASGLSVETAQAQGTTVAPAVETQQFHPVEDVSGSIMTSGTNLIPAGKIHGGAWLNFAKEPLIFRSEGGDFTVLQDNVLGLDLTAAVGVTKRLQLGISIPVTLYQSLTIENPYVYEGASTALNDINVRARFQLADRQKKAFGFAFEPRLTLPTGNAESFTGGQTLLSGNLLIDRAKRGKWVGLNVGYRHRFLAATLGNLNLGPDLTYRLGFGLPSKDIYWTFDIFGAVGAAAQAADAIPEAVYADKPLEVMLGASKAFDRFTATVGVGAGVIAGVGTPDFRLVASLAWGEIRGGDRDGDGIPDNTDLCPDDPEDFDGFEDTDGCPDPDNDKDTILDVKDSCPNVPETFNGVDDTDGCPEVDTDKDGIFDPQDKCPLIPENFNGIDDTDGCPEVDTDGDGIYDNLDRCPTEPEDKDGFEDTDGCPDLDNDQDGIPDTKDKCPNDKETVNGFEDEDGCPEFDRDGDGINDASDQCPDVPEDKDGDQDWDGCPEETLADYVKLEPIYFYVDSDRIRSVSFGTLNKVSGVLNKFKDLCVAIQGHTSLEGTDEHNQALSEKRSLAVEKYLVGQSIDTTRLDAAGFGEKYPAVDEAVAEGMGKEALEDARESNRRIEFVIIDCQTRAPKQGKSAPGK